MRVALIAAPYPLEELPSPPLGLGYVAAAFEAAGCEVKILDYIVSRYSREKIAAQLEAFQPDAVGSGSVTMNFHDARRILRDVKAINPDILTMMGGPHVSFTVAQTLNHHPEIDVIFRGESEDTIAQFVPVMADPDRWGGIAGIAYRRDGAIVDNGRRAFIDDPDRLPLPARRLMPISRYKALGFPVSMITGRGCPYGCIFCSGRKMVGPKLRRRSTASVLDEVEDILDLGFERINIADDLFASDTERVRDICTGIHERGLKFDWSAFARVDTVTQEMLDLMAKAGCDSVSYGIESGCPDMLKRVRKGILIDQAEAAVRMCKQAGMQAHASFMVGLPGETLESLERTDAFARSLDTFYGYHFLAPFPGTTVRENIGQYDLKILTDDWSQYHANDAVVQTSAVTPGDLRDFVGRYEADINRRWQEMLTAYGTGRNSPSDEMRVEGHHRMHITFAILKNDLVEKLGFVESALLNGDPDAAGPVLEDRMAAVLEGDKRLIRKTVADFVSRGYLTPEPCGNGVAWRWHRSPGREQPLRAQACA